MSRSVGFIGLGIMGRAMARRLVDAKHQVTVYNRDASKAKELVAAGAKQAETPRAAAEGNDVIISMVSDSAAVGNVLLGPDGAVHGTKTGAVIVDMSTINPGSARRIGVALRGRGVAFLDAPVTGMEVRAREGTLSILVGGEKKDLDKVRDVLSVLGNNITHFGKQGAGQLAKACNQILCAVNMMGIVEALHLARLGGLDPAQLVEALVPGAGGSWALERFGPQIAKGDFEPGGRIALMLKDLGIIEDTARELGLPLSGVIAAKRYFQDNKAHDEADLGTQAMYKAVERAIEKAKGRRSLSS
ncbi:MAG TPA: NAD(P)-dependent oxidoreductase [Planctomycetota bacterium]|jgi:3-hydroxyisobutyrate dehydrogenase|nr:NAD(P)-dependent oxidoreductase [Planctomycetota bacterium]